MVILIQKDAIISQLNEHLKYILSVRQLIFSALFCVDKNHLIKLLNISYLS